MTAAGEGGPAFTAACIQFTAGSDPEPNLHVVADLVRRAREEVGAELIMTPEASNFIESGRRRRDKARLEGGDRFLAGMRDLARELGVWLLLGSLVIDPAGEAGSEPGEERLANRSFLIDASGGIVARYDKIHMFDIDLPGGESYRESNAYRPGRDTAVADTPWGRLGLSVCYDVRFPYLYRTLAHAGAEFLTVPSVFTVPTGRAHWHVLLRARAIENGCFVFAPAQCGEHPIGRKSYGHSLIVDPWGDVLADGGEEPGFVSARIDPARVAEARRSVPSLTHDRPAGPPQLSPLPEAAEAQGRGTRPLAAE
jgi:deaminated glutathione amidase